MLIYQSVLGSVWDICSHIWFFTFSPKIHCVFMVFVSFRPDFDCNLHIFAVSFPSFILVLTIFMTNCTFSIHFWDYIYFRPFVDLDIYPISSKTFLEFTANSSFFSCLYTFRRFQRQISNHFWNLHWVFAAHHSSKFCLPKRNSKQKNQVLSLLRIAAKKVKNSV